MTANPNVPTINIRQIDSGAWEIRVRSSNHFPLIGYAYSVQDTPQNQFYVFYVLESGQLLPFPRTNDYLYVPCEMTGVSDPASFYAWVEKHGGLGPNPETYEVFERIDPWTP